MRILIVCIALLVSCGESKESQESKTLVALGDSITTGFNSRKALQNNPDLSWVTGNSSLVESVVQKLAKRVDTVESYNLAKTGSQAEDLEAQLKLVPTDQFNLASVQTGANDICKWPMDFEGQLSQFKTDMDNITQSLLNLNPDVKILLVPIPNMLNLYNVAKDLECSGIWVLTNCKDLLGKEATDKTRVNFAERIKQANEVIKGIADSRGKNVYYSEKVAKIEFGKSDISSIDCFHPSVSGQQLLSDAAGIEWAL